MPSFILPKHIAEARRRALENGEAPPQITTIIGANGIKNFWTEVGRNGSLEGLDKHKNLQKGFRVFHFPRNPLAKE